MKDSTSAEGRVETNKKDPLWAEPGHLPAIRIFGTTESIEEVISAPRQFNRMYFLAVTICAIEEKGIAAEDMIDHIDQQVRNILLEDNTLDGMIADVVPTSLQIDFGEEESEVETGILTTVYSFKYSDRPVEDVEDQQWRGISELEILNTKYNINPDNDGDSPDGVTYELEDTLDLKQQ